MKRALVMHGAFCDRSLGMTLGMTLVYPVQSGVAIRGGYAAHTAHIVRLPDALLCRSFVCNSRKYVVGVLPRKKISKT